MSPTDTTESSAPGCLTNIRKSLSEKGVSEKSTTLINFGHHGEEEPPELTSLPGEGGLAGVLQGKLILFQ